MPAKTTPEASPVLLIGCASPTCQTVFNARLDYAGVPHNGQRRYCTEQCRDEARNAVRRARTQWRRQHEALIDLHVREDAGQLSLDPTPLPPLPPRPSLTRRTQLGARRVIDIPLPEENTHA